jgi:hypothetical protein
MSLDLRSGAPFARMCLFSVHAKRAVASILPYKQVHHQPRKVVKNSKVITGAVAVGIAGGKAAISSDGVYSSNKITVETSDESELDILYIKCCVTDICPFVILSSYEGEGCGKKRRRGGETFWGCSGKVSSYKGEIICIDTPQERMPGTLLYPASEAFLSYAENMAKPE